MAIQRSLPSGSELVPANEHHIHTVAPSVLPCRIASTGPVSRRQRQFDFWHDVVSRNLVDLGLYLVAPARLRAHVSAAPRWTPSMFENKATAHRGPRSAATIIRSGPKPMGFNFVLSRTNGLPSKTGDGDYRGLAKAWCATRAGRFPALRPTLRDRLREAGPSPRPFLTKLPHCSASPPFSFHNEIVSAGVQLSVRTAGGTRISISDGSSRRISNSFIELSRRCWPKQPRPRPRR